MKIKDMQAFLTTASIFHNFQTYLLFFIYIAARVLSFFLYDHPVAQGVLVFAIIIAFGIIYFKNYTWAWYVVLGELLLGGAGHFFEFFGLSLRTLLLATFFFLWILHSASQLSLRHRTFIQHRIFYWLIPLAVFLFIGFVQGVLNGHRAVAIVQDLLPYGFFALLLPAYHLFQEKETQAYLVRLLLVFILGSALFSLFTFLYYSGGFGELQDAYYHWFRNGAAGKITDMGNHFFRIVTPEHLLLTPLALLICSLIMRTERHNPLWYAFLFLALLTLVLDLSRIYAIAFTAGLVILAYKHNKLRWIAVSGAALAVTVLLFFSVHFLASRGTSFGWELFAGRAASIAQPELETSAYTRTALLEPAIALIKENPVFGNGLGATITYLNPITYRTVRTSAFDWGYLEMLAELGILGTLAFLSVIGLGIAEIIKKIRSAPDWHDFYVGLLAGSVAFLFMNITFPALFHVFGIVWFVFVLTFAMKPHTIFDPLVVLLYRIFNRLKT